MTTQTEALKALVHEMEYVLSCINEEKVSFDGDDFHEALRLGKEALAQPEQEPVAIMREMLEVQGQHGNWNYDSYMHGLYNGMEYMVALAEKREPQFRDAPETWLAKYEVKRNNFNSTYPLTEATPPQRTWVGLTDGDMQEIIGTSVTMGEFIKNTEAKLKEKNT